MKGLGTKVITGGTGDPDEDGGGTSPGLATLTPELRAELDSLEESIASLEKALDGKAGRILLTEVGILMESIPGGAIVGTNWPIIPDGTPAVGDWDESALTQLENFFRLDYNRPLIRMVDVPEVLSLQEVSRDRVWQTIGSFLESFNIKVYLCRDRVKTRGLIPTEVLEIPPGSGLVKREAIIPSAGEGDKGDRIQGIIS